MAEYTLKYNKEELSKNLSELLTKAIKDTCHKSSDFDVWTAALRTGLNETHAAAVAMLNAENELKESKEALDKLIESHGDKISLKEALKKVSE